MLQVDAQPVKIDEEGRLSLVDKIEDATHAIISMKDLIAMGKMIGGASNATPLESVDVHEDREPLIELP